MKLKIKKEIHNKTIEELKMMLKNAKDDLFKLSMDHAQKKLKNTKNLFWKKKEIAVILSILKEKEFEHENI